MEINTWQNPALAPAFGMPIDGPASRAAHTLTCGALAGVVAGRAITGIAPVRVDAVRVKGNFPGSDAWSPPIS